MKSNRRPRGTPKTGGRKKGSGGRRLFLTIPKAQADRMGTYTDNEIRALIITALGKIKKNFIKLLTNRKTIPIFVSTKRRRNNAARKIEICK